MLATRSGSALVQPPEAPKVGGRVPLRRGRPRPDDPSGCRPHYEYYPWMVRLDDKLIFWAGPGDDAEYIGFNPSKGTRKIKSQTRDVARFRLDSPTIVPMIRFIRPSETVEKRISRVFMRVGGCARQDSNLRPSDS